MRALRPYNVVGSQTHCLKGSGRSVLPIQHTPGSCDGGLCVSQSPIIPQAPTAAFSIKGSAGGTRHRARGPHQIIPVLVFVLHQSNAMQLYELTSSLHQCGQRRELSKQSKLSLTNYPCSLLGGEKKGKTNKTTSKDLC